MSVFWPEAKTALQKALTGAGSGGHQQACQQQRPALHAKAGRSSFLSLKGRSTEKNAGNATR